MSGLGRKVFVRERLTSADVNGFLMDQTVMRFASASARAAEIASPSEGMVTYLDDQNALEFHTGTGWERLLHGVRGPSNASSDANGWVTFTHGLGVTPSSVQITPGGGPVQHLCKFIVAAKTSTQVSVIAYNTTSGSTLASNPVPFDYLVLR